MAVPSVIWLCTGCRKTFVSRGMKREGCCVSYLILVDVKSIVRAPDGMIIDAQASDGLAKDGKASWR